MFYTSLKSHSGAAYQLLCILENFRFLVLLPHGVYMSRSVFKQKTIDFLCSEECRYGANFRFIIIIINVADVVGSGFHV